MLGYINKIKKEYLYLATLIFFILLLKVYDKDSPDLQLCQIIMVLVYCVAAIFVNYFLFPKYFSRGKIKYFVLFFLLAIFFVVAFEEFVYEKIFFADTKGSFTNISGALIEIIPVYVILVGFKFVWDTYEKQNKIEHLKRLVAESELQNFNSQISPHFLFNNLNTLYSYAIENSSKTPEIILELSGILRYMLYDCKQKYVPLENEIENLKNFVDLNKLQLDTRGNVSFTYPQNISDKYISPLILIVFVENAFKHASSSQTENINVNVKIELEDHNLNFHCENTFEDNINKTDLAKGIGLKNVTNRLKIVYPNKHNLKINSDNNKYNVFLTIDLKND